MGPLRDFTAESDAASPLSASVDGSWEGGSLFVAANATGAAAGASPAPRRAAVLVMDYDDAECSENTALNGRSRGGRRGGSEEPPGWLER